MLSEDEIYLYAASFGWMACFDFLHAGEYVRWVFLERGSQVHPWGPSSA
jgi:hypothetical protein